MSAEVIRMDRVVRSHLPSSYEEVRFDGFRRALKALDSLKGCSQRETIVALENWAASGLMTETEVDELFAHHGWRRGA